MQINDNMNKTEMQLDEGGVKIVDKKGRYKNKYNLFFKDFDSVRDIVRSAFLYGGYSKTDYCKLTGISPRKYEDAVRFMQAVFGEDYCTYENKGKEKYTRLNYKAFENCANPLARVAFFKGFTENDFNCYFYVLDILSDKPEGLTVEELVDMVSLRGYCLLDRGTLRNGLESLVDEGYLTKAPKGRKVLYKSTDDLSATLSKEELFELADYIAFVKDIYSHRIPLYTLAAKLPESKFGDKVKLTEYYPVQVLDAQVKYILETAITEKRIVKFTYTTTNREKVQIETAMPVRLLEGEYGRQYVFCFVDFNIRCGVFRLDRIRDLELTGITMEVEFDESYLDKVWCVSITQEHIEHNLEIDFNFGGDRMLANRLKNSKKYGNVTELNGIHRFTVTVKDYGEMFPMLRSFYGYIVRINNEELKNKVKEDIKNIGGLYGLI